MFDDRRETTHQYVPSIDWFKGQITGKSHISRDNLWFPVDFPLSQPINSMLHRSVPPCLKNNEAFLKCPPRVGQIQSHSVGCIISVYIYIIIISIITIIMFSFFIIIVVIIIIIIITAIIIVIMHVVLYIPILY